MSQAKVNGTVTTGGDYDAVVVGASLAGCATAILLARDGARVALVEQRPDQAAYKKICSHYIQSSAVASLERLVSRVRSASAEVSSAAFELSSSSEELAATTTEQSAAVTEATVR